MNKLRDYLNRHELERSNTAGDFTTNWRVIPVSFLAVFIGAVAAGVAWLLLRLIGFATNLFYYQRLSSTLAKDARAACPPDSVVMSAASRAGERPTS